MNKTELANFALGHLGSALIQSIDEVSPAAQHCRRMWDFVRDGLLRQKDWNFALGRAVLARLQEAPVFGWAAAYALPTDYLRALEWNGMEAGTGEAEFDIEGGRLLCDVAGAEASSALGASPIPTPPHGIPEDEEEEDSPAPASAPPARAELRYVRRVENVSEWDASFCEAFSYKLAGAIAPAMSSSAGLADGLNRMAEQVMYRAFGPDNLETRPRVVLAQAGSGWRAAREGAGNW